MVSFLRGEDGSWIIGFKGSVGMNDILLVELKAIQHGLHMFWDNGYKKVIYESDSGSGSFREHKLSQIPPYGAII